MNNKSYTTFFFSRLIPETKPLLDMCQQNFDRWQNISTEMQQKRDEKAKESEKTD